MTQHQRNCIDAAQWVIDEWHRLWQAWIDDGRKPRPAASEVFEARKRLWRALEDDCD